jgi:putative NADH-flavin reductase
MTRLRYWLRATLSAAILSVVANGAAFAAEPLEVVVFGGTGAIGQRIVREALDRGHHVTVVSRDPSRVKEKHERLTAQQGNVLDSAQVAKIAAGKDVVISAIGADRANNPDYDIYRKAAQSLVSALRTLGAKAPRLIVVGGAGSLEIAPGVLLVTKIPEQYRREVLGQKDALDYYRTVKDVQWTYFSPAGSIAPGTRTGKFRLGGDQLVTDESGNSKISTEDYAVALIDEAEQPKHTGKRFTIAY